jgi:hypothetical protein
MAIIRVVVVDPQPRTPCDDIIVYQVPENSRACELLCKMLEVSEVQHVKIEPTKPKRKVKQAEIDQFNKELENGNRS